MEERKKMNESGNGSACANGVGKELERRGIVSSELGALAYSRTLNDKEKEALLRGDYFGAGDFSSLETAAKSIEGLIESYSHFNKKAFDIIAKVQSSNGRDFRSEMRLGERCAYAARVMADCVFRGNSRGKYLELLHHGLSDRILERIVSDYDREIAASDALRESARKQAYGFEQAANKDAFQIDVLKREYDLAGRVLNEGGKVIGERREKLVSIEDPAELFEEKKKITDFRNKEMLEVRDRKIELFRKIERKNGSHRIVRAQQRLALFNVRVVDKYLAGMVHIRDKLDYFRNSRNAWLDIKVQSESLKLVEAYEGLAKELSGLQEDVAKMQSEFVRSGELQGVDKSGIYSSSSVLESDIEKMDEAADRRVWEIHSEIHREYFGAND